MYSDGQSLIDEFRRAPELERLAAVRCEDDFWRAAFMAAIRLPPIESSDLWLATDVVNDAGVVADAAVAEAKKRGRLG